MNALTFGGGGNKYLRRGTKVTVRKATKYFTAVADLDYIMTGRRFS